MQRSRGVALALALVAVSAACGSDDDERADVAETGTGNPYTQAIIESTSHDEILIAGGDMVVAVDCFPDEGDLPVMTVVANGLPDGVYAGIVEPSTGVDIGFAVGGSAQVVATEAMELGADTYTVTFADIPDGVFDLSGC